MDYDKLSTVEQRLQRKRRVRWWITLLLLALGSYYFVFERTYVIRFADDEEHFKYGSIGSEGSSGLPYWVFKALPELFADKLGPQGFGKFGFIYETPDSDLPIGFSQRVVQGVNRVWLNCAGCHVGTYVDPAGEVQLIVGGSANRLRLLDLVQFQFTGHFFNDPVGFSFRGVSVTPDKRQGAASGQQNSPDNHNCF